MESKNSGRSKTYDTDAFMKQAWKHLAEDFRAVTWPTFCKEQEETLFENVKNFRDIAWPAKSQAPAYLFKRVYQLENFFKRYIFANDAHTQQTLESMTNEKFVKTQERVASTPIVRTLLLHRVLQRARSINKRILGKYNVEEHMALCRFGKRASVGNPKKRSYLDLKLEGPISGSLEHIRWMNQVYLPTDNQLGMVLGKRDASDVAPTYSVCESLAITNVPKSWKSLRGIMPNTTCGSFYTYGLGKMISNRLKVAGLNIKHLQNVHKILAKRHSKPGETEQAEQKRLVTADLSAASDSFGADVVNMLFPREWYKALKYGRLDTVTQDGSQIYLASFMGMGIGYTFPLQTLAFYSIITAVKELLEKRGRISVYGDDLIYPRTIHNCVVHVLAQLRFKINKDKTFVNDAFRESCGGDYFRGVDVRPYSPQGQARALPRVQYLALLYKTINGLSRRWDLSEISRTINFMLREVLRVTDRIHQVPPSYPDYSGVKVGRPQQDWHIPWHTVKYSKTGCCLEFIHLKQEDDRRIVPKVDAYYWQTMRITQDPCENAKPLCGLGSIKFYIQRNKWVREVGESLLKWVRDRHRLKIIGLKANE